MATTRAKFRCVAEKNIKYSENGDPTRSYDFQALYDDTIPEDVRYAKYTPTGNMTIGVDNPNVRFVPGKSYYLDITPADEALAP